MVDALEVGVNPASLFRPGNELGRRADERASWTCAIYNGVGGFGTGLLVGRNLVLTNYHVIKGLLARPASFRQATCRFDFTDDVMGEGTPIPFADSWEGPWSAYSEKDMVGADTGFEPDRLDYAIIRLAEPVGEQPVRIGRSQRNPRGWLPLPSNPAPSAIGQPLIIWQHPIVRETLMTKPQVMRLQYAPGSVINILDQGLRLRHDVETERGSSGAPCFDANLDLIALHHSGDPQADENRRGKWNQAVPMTVIVAHLKATGHGDLIGVVPPAPVPLAPVSSAEQAADMVDKRVRAATILMDRETDEDNVAWARDKQNGLPGMVHVVACRQVDSHRNFLERLQRLGLASQNDGLDAKQRRIQAFLKTSTNAVSAEAWQAVVLAWRDAREPADLALSFLRRGIDKVAGAAAAGVNQMVEVAIDVALVSLAREKKLVPMVADYCSKVATADRMQVFLVYYDLTDKFRERRKELARMWSPLKRPVGCGICLYLNDISSPDLEGWCRSVQATWQGQEGQLIGEIEPLFKDGRLPMQAVEEGVGPIVRKRVAVLPGGI